MAIPPHLFIQVGCDHCRVGTAHTLEPSLNGAPVRLNVVGARAGGWVTKMLTVVYRRRRVDVAQVAHRHTTCRTIWCRQAPQLAGWWLSASYWSTSFMYLCLVSRSQTLKSQLCGLQCPLLYFALPFSWSIDVKGENKSQLIDIDSQPHKTMFHYTDSTL